MSQRFNALKMLLQQFSELKDSDPRNWPGNFRPHGSMTECNFGGLLIIVSADGQFAITWRDWAGDAIDTSFKLHEICNWYQDENDEICIGDSYITVDGQVISLNNFLII